MYKQLTIGIDASNIVIGGGLVHLQNLLGNINPSEDLINKVIVWCSPSLSIALPKRSWIKYIEHPLLSKRKIHRIVWQIFASRKSAIQENCDLIFIPGGVYFGLFRPYVCMIQNMQIFEISELNRETFFSREWFRLHMLRWMHLFSVFGANGVIFPSKYALDYINSNYFKYFKYKRKSVINHGIESFYGFPRSTKFQNSIIKVICVSTIKKYKHQWNLIDAISILHSQGLNLRLDIFGSGDDNAISLMNEHAERCNNSQIYYHGAVSREDLYSWYQCADIFVFPSTCEAFGISVVEAMSFGLSVACSNYGPLPNICKDAAIYFDPLDPRSIADAIKFLIENRDVSFKNIDRAIEYSKLYNWRSCTKATCNFFHHN